MGAKRLDEASVNFFIEQFCSKADVVFRLAFALTLNLETARRCTESAFKAVAEGLDQALRTTNPTITMLKACYEAFKKSGASAPAGASALTAALRGMSVEARAALVAIDYVGLDPAELEKVFGWDELRARQLAAEARRVLQSSNVKL